MQLPCKFRGVDFVMHGIYLKHIESHFAHFSKLFGNIRSDVMKKNYRKEVPKVIS